MQFIQSTSFKIDKTTKSAMKWSPSRHKKAIGDEGRERCQVSACATKPADSMIDVSNDIQDWIVNALDLFANGWKSDSWGFKWIELRSLGEERAALNGTSPVPVSCDQLDDPICLTTSLDMQNQESPDCKISMNLPSYVINRTSSSDRSYKMVAYRMKLKSGKGLSQFCQIDWCTTVRSM